MSEERPQHLRSLPKAQQRPKEPPASLIPALRLSRKLAGGSVVDEDVLAFSVTPKVVGKPYKE